MKATDKNIIGGKIEYFYKTKKDVIYLVNDKGEQKKVSLKYGKSILNKKDLPLFKNQDIFIYTENRTENGIYKNKIQLINRTFFNNMTNKETLKFFRRLGGSETAQKSYTSKGYIITRLLSKSPDRKTSVERLFKPI